MCPTDHTFIKVKSSVCLSVFMAPFTILKQSATVKPLDFYRKNIYTHLEAGWVLLR